jgi:hypothetical protein
MHIAANHKTLADQIGESSVAARQQVAAVFAPELAKAGKEKSSVLDRTDLILSWAVWDGLRTGQGTSADRARKIVTEMLNSTLGSYAGRSR